MGASTSTLSTAAQAGLSAAQTQQHNRAIRRQTRQDKKQLKLQKAIEDRQREEALADSLSASRAQAAASGQDPDSGSARAVQRGLSADARADDRDREREYQLARKQLKSQSRAARRRNLLALAAETPGAVRPLTAARGGRLGRLI